MKKIPYVRTEEIKEKNRLANTGEKNGMFGVIPWNKGLTKETDMRMLVVSKSITGKPHTRESYDRGNDNRRGEKNGMYGKLSAMFGKHHTDISKNKMSVSHLGEKNSNYGKKAAKGAGNGKGGIREDLGMYFRSRWEANQARVFNYEGIPFEFESKRFELKRPDGSKITYCPDFLVAGSVWYEVKGYMNEQSKEKDTLFRTQYPNEILLVVEKDKYDRMESTYRGLIPNWENK